ncbi:hypothetical protein TNCT_478781 [Trichonephila clavata]|uniref:Uncharacterized protein n=1 Tax=Trichonephila clavata TaxID=2740835 RepID=A0A8X6G303_TRICU|nr:hypothetical protein TNCT_478781 [Trichonephila clavata]
MRDSPGPRREELLLNHHQLNGREQNKFEKIQDFKLTGRVSGRKELQDDWQSHWSNKVLTRVRPQLDRVRDQVLRNHWQSPNQGMAATGQSQGQSPAVPLVESRPGTSSMRGQSLRTKPNAIQAGIHAHNWKQEQQGLTGTGILTGLQGSEEGSPRPKAALEQAAGSAGS